MLYGSFFLLLLLLCLLRLFSYSCPGPFYLFQLGSKERDEFGRRIEQALPTVAAVVSFLCVSSPSLDECMYA